MKIRCGLSPPLSVGEGVQILSSIISYKTNLAPSPTERVGERLLLLKVESESYLEAEFRQVAVVEAPFVVYRRFDSNRT